MKLRATTCAPPFSLTAPVQPGTGQERTGQNMLGYVINTAQGPLNGLLAEVAAQCVVQGLRVAGAVQVNDLSDPSRRGPMDLIVLGQGSVVRISQDRGQFAAGCRLDPQGLAHAVALVEAALDRDRPDLLIINKFGKSEAEGSGFRDVLGKAMVAGVRVLTSVSSGQMDGFQNFAGGMATELPADVLHLCDWCLRAKAGAA